MVFLIVILLTFFFLILGCHLTILIVRICVELVSCCKSKPPGHRYQGCAIGRAEARSQLESAGSCSLPGLCEDTIAVHPPSRVESCVGAQKGTVEVSLKKA